MLPSVSVKRLLSNLARRMDLQFLRGVERVSQEAFNDYNFIDTE